MINRLETELDTRHDEEVANLKMSQVTLSEAPEEASPEQEERFENKSIENTPKVSKAQKRRDKKANAEKERNERIIEQEVLNVFGKRNVETQAIKKILVARGLMIYEIPSDGHW